MLLNLPPSLLGLVVEFSPLVLRLWLCGNRSLNLKLQNAVEYVVLTPIPGVCLRFPKMLTQLRHLRSLEVYSPWRKLKEIAHWHSMLDELSNSLESLKIVSKDGDRLFDAGAPLFKDTPDRPSYYLQLEAIFPKLHTLSLKGSDLPLEKEFLRFLPSTLTSLCTPGCPLLLPCMSELPPALTYLEANICTRTDEEEVAFDNLALCPPGLEIAAIRAPGFKGPRLHQWLAKLSPSATPGLIVDLSLHDATPDLIAFLPRSLLHLRITQNTLDWTRFHPDAMQADAGGTSHICLWPPALQSLSMPINSLNLGMINALPRSLMDATLRILVEDANPTLYASELPPRLSSLKLTSRGGLLLEGRLPSQMTHFDPSRVVKLDPANLLAALPDSLKTLGHVATAFTSPTMPFPSTLTNISVTTWSSDCFCALPRSTTRFFTVKLEASPVVDAGSGAQSQPSDTGNGASLDDCTAKRVFADVPLSMADFECYSFDHPGAGLLSRNTTFTAPSDSFAHLPSLTRLVLPDNVKLPSACLRHLPRAMKELRVTLEKIENFAEELAFLPPRLIQCSIGGSLDFKDIRLAQYWPPTAIESLSPNTTKKFRKRLLERLKYH